MLKIADTEGWPQRVKGSPHITAGNRKRLSVVKWQENQFCQQCEWDWKLICPPDSREKNNPADTLVSILWDPEQRTLPCYSACPHAELWVNKWVLFSAVKFCGNLLGSNRKLVHIVNQRKLILLHHLKIIHNSLNWNTVLIKIYSWQFLSLGYVPQFSDTLFNLFASLIFPDSILMPLFPVNTSAPSFV